MPNDLKSDTHKGIGRGSKMGRVIAYVDSNRKIRKTSNVHNLIGLWLKLWQLRTLKKIFH